MDGRLAGLHVVAVWQSCIGALAAASIMAEDGDPAQPRSMTLMAAPIDARINPAKLNELTLNEPAEWIERNLIVDAPPLFEGASGAPSTKAQAWTSHISCLRARAPLWQTGARTGARSPPRRDASANEKLSLRRPRFDNALPYIKVSVN